MKSTFDESPPDLYKLGYFAENQDEYSEEGQSSHGDSPKEPGEDLANQGSDDLSQEEASSEEQQESQTSDYRARGSQKVLSQAHLASSGRHGNRNQPKRKAKRSPPKMAEQEEPVFTLTEEQCLKSIRNSLTQFRRNEAIKTTQQYKQRLKDQEQDQLLGRLAKLIPETGEDDGLALRKQFERSLGAKSLRKFKSLQKQKTALASKLSKQRLFTLKKRHNLKCQKCDQDYKRWVKEAGEEAQPAQGAPKQSELEKKEGTVPLPSHPANPGEKTAPTDETLPPDLSSSSSSDSEEEADFDNILTRLLMEAEAPEKKALKPPLVLKDKQAAKLHFSKHYHQLDKCHQQAEVAFIKRVQAKREKADQRKRLKILGLTDDLPPPEEPEPKQEASLEEETGEPTEQPTTEQKKRPGMKPRAEIERLIQQGTAFRQISFTTDGRKRTKIVYLVTCPVCHRKDLDQSHFQRHLLTHNGPKEHRCDLCGKQFALSYNLKIHRRIHAKEKLFKCEEPGCTYSFAQKPNLQKHALRHAKGLRLRKEYQSRYIIEEPSEQSSLTTPLKDLSEVPSEGTWDAPEASADRVFFTSKLAKNKAATLMEVAQSNQALRNLFLWNLGRKIREKAQPGVFGGFVIPLPSYFHIEQCLKQPHPDDDGAVFAKEVITSYGPSPLTWRTILRLNPIFRIEKEGPPTSRVETLARVNRLELKFARLLERRRNLIDQGLRSFIERASAQEQVASSATAVVEALDRLRAENVNEEALASMIRTGLNQFFSPRPAINDRSEILREVDNMWRFRNSRKLEAAYLDQQEKLEALFAETATEDTQVKALFEQLLSHRA